MPRAAPILAVLALLGGCDEPPPDADAGAPDAGRDAGPPDAGVDAGPDPGALCDELGLPRRPFDATAAGTELDELAGDFTAETLDGPWTFSETWTGCESTVFLLHTAGLGDALFASAPDDLFAAGPRNVHYVFGAWDPDEANVRARMEAMRDTVEDTFAFLELSEEERAFWRARVHYVVQPMATVEGPMNGFLTATGRLRNAFAITPSQRLDPVGSLAVFTSAGLRLELATARFAPPWYDHLAALDDRLADTEGVTVVPLLNGETTTARSFEPTVTLPDAATMAGFDTLELDVELTCRLPFTDCSEWDRIAHVFVCEGADCATRRELVRWITPYSRPGRRRWAIDATPMLPLLRDGGERTFRVVLGPDWERATERTVSVRLRLSDEGREEVPIAAELAFEGGNFDATYNEGREPFTFTPPAEATRVELVTIVSGHGQAASNCAEWCEHVHTFAVEGGGTHVVAFPGEVGAIRCAEATGQGVVPGQHGNWIPGRAGWCPGLPVAPVRQDITAEITPGAPASVTYTGSFAGGDPPGGNIVLSTYAVSYAPR